MPVELITQGLNITCDRVFIIPTQRNLAVHGGEFLPQPISKPREWSDVITLFLRSLTRHWDGQIIAVIVSGMMAMARRRCAAYGKRAASPSPSGRKQPRNPTRRSAR